MWGFVQNPSSPFAPARKRPHVPIKNCWYSEDQGLGNHVNTLTAYGFPLKRPSSTSSGLTLETLLGDQDGDGVRLHASHSATMFGQWKAPVSQHMAMKINQSVPELSHIKAALGIAQNEYDTDHHDDVPHSRKQMAGFSREAALLSAATGRRRVAGEEQAWQPRPVKAILGRVGSKRRDFMQRPKPGTAPKEDTSIHRHRNAVMPDDISIACRQSLALHKSRASVSSQNLLGSNRQVSNGRDASTALANARVPGNMGPKRAIDVDRRFQQELQQQWERELGEVNYMATIQSRQLGQLFEFLQTSDPTPDGSGLVEGASHFIPTMLKNIISVESEQLLGAPDADMGAGVELQSNQAQSLREALQSFALTSRPVRVTNDSPNKKDLAESERVYRPTFCRFLIDCNLCTASDTKYHYAVRLFDNVALSHTNRGTEAHAPKVYAAVGSASIDLCMGIICQILGRAPNPTQASNKFFDVDLIDAQKVADALRDEQRERHDAAMSLAAQEKAADPNDEKQKEFMKIIGTPPQFFNGSIRDWANGSRAWQQVLEEQSEPEVIGERASQSFALECFLTDQLCEPSCLCVCESFRGLFQSLFNAYWDEERTTYDKHRSPRLAKHMSCAGFFRFCFDFGVFPAVCSASDVWKAWQSAECLFELTPFDPNFPPSLAKLKRAFKSVHSMIADVRKFKEALAEKQKLAEDAENLEGLQEEEEEPAVKGKESTVRAKQEASKTRRSSAIDPRGRSGSLQGPTADNKEDMSKAGAGKKNSPLPSGLKGPADAIQNAKKQLQLSVQEKVGTVLSQDSLSVTKSEDTKKGAGGARRSVIAPKAPSLKIPELAVATGKELKLSPSTSEDKEKEQEEEKEKEKERPPRLKMCIDLCWLTKPISRMTVEEVNLYDLLCALKDCGTDRFLCVRGLFESVSIETNESIVHKGSVNAASLLVALKKLDVTHSLTAQDLEACIRRIDPNAGEDGIETSELEKAVNKLVQIEMKNDPARMSISALGEQARRLDDEDVWFRKPEDPTDTVTVFGWEAFMESLMRLAVAHLHRGGVGIQVSSPGGVKAMWLITFLRYSYDKLKGKEARQMDWLKSCERAVSANNVGAENATPVADRLPRKCGPGRHPCAIYSSNRLRMLAIEPSPFQPYDHIFEPCGNVKADDIFKCTSTEEDDAESKAFEECSVCKRRRSSKGMGSLFCHSCSGVDDIPLPDNALFAVLMRKRLQLNMRDKDAQMAEKEQEPMEQEKKDDFYELVEAKLGPRGKVSDRKSSKISAPAAKAHSVAREAPPKQQIKKI